MLNSNHKIRVVVGLSGGVDSSVAAYLLKEQGYDVIGLFMVNWDSVANQEQSSDLKTTDGCSSQQDFQDAQAVADKLKIPLYQTQFIKEYWDDVFLHFLNELKNNRTPNPDVLCNQFIKFDRFLAYAKKHFDCDFIAMGHYAQVSHQKDQSLLLKAKDKNKDQTYFLCNLNQKQLQKSLFPIGHLTKEQVRTIAKEQGLITASKKDSTGICFIGERKFASFLNNYLPNEPGLIVDIVSLKSVGKHIGVMYYTLGQRKGLNLGGMNERYFVCDKDIQTKTLYVAPLSLQAKYLYSDQAIIENLNWIVDYDQNQPTQVRFLHRGNLVDVSYLNQVNSTDWMIKYTKSRCVTPGQYAVFYQNDVCIGGGVIKQTNANNKQLAF